MKQKRAWLAAILNIIVPGAGYLYVGRRKVFGALLTLSSAPTGCGARPRN